MWGAFVRFLTFLQRGLLFINKTGMDIRIYGCGSLSPLLPINKHLWGARRHYVTYETLIRFNISKREGLGGKTTTAPKAKLSFLVSFLFSVLSQLFFSLCKRITSFSLVEENSNFHSLVRLTCSCWICRKPLSDRHAWLRHSSACSVCVHGWLCLHLRVPPWLLWRRACLWGWVAPFVVFSCTSLHNLAGHCYLL